MNKYEKLIEHIINNDTKAAKELFHQIVVEKSRDIYEDLDSEDLASDTLADDLNDIDEDEYGSDVDEYEADEDLDDADDELEDDDLDDAEDDLDDADDELEDRVLDLEDALDDLRAEFDELMSDDDYEELDDAEDELDDAEIDSDEAEDDMDDVEDDLVGESRNYRSRMLEARKRVLEREKEMKKKNDTRKKMREYVEKVEGFADEEGIQAGARGNSKIGVNKNSLKFQKNDMGGTAKNLVRGGANEAPDGKTPTRDADNAYTKGRGKLSGSGKFANVPGGRGDKLNRRSEGRDEDGRPAGSKDTMGGRQNRRSIEGDE